MAIILWVVPNFHIDHSLQLVTDSYGRKRLLSTDEGRSIGRMPLLYQEDGTGISIANNWLIHLKADLYKKEVDTQAQALLHYFTFLHDIGVAWDCMPVVIRKRPTYLFKKHLKEAFRSRNIARSTANSYMGVVIRFYKFYLMKKYSFDNRPFNYEIVKIEASRKHDFMGGNLLQVDSTDLRLNLPRDSRHNGLSRSLVPLSQGEWDRLDRHFNSRGKGIVQRAGENLSVAISVEFKLAVYLARYCGLRRDEIITLRSSQVYKPVAGKLSKKYLINSYGFLLDPRFGVRTKNSTIRYAEVPTAFMNDLHRYINSTVYTFRRDKFINKHPEEVGGPPLLITQKGDMYSPATLDARWGELRNALRENDYSFDHKFHNLRSTYAVFRLAEMINAGIKEAVALDYLQSVLGHKKRTTLLAYLRFCEQEKSANQVYEEVLENLLESENGISREE